MNKMSKLMTMITIAVASLLLSGCAWLAMEGSTRYQKSSVAQYLYSDKDGHIERPSVPVLELPLRVGMAFVPEGSRNAQGFTEQSKTRLLENVKGHFQQQKFVHSIELIPSIYLKENGGFTNLDQIATMYDVDVMVLLGYDQQQFVDEGFASVAYWTIIGAYIVPGEKNDTHTMLDAAVYDVKSRKMLFRAPGISQIKSKATPVNLSEQLRLDSGAGFNKAQENLLVNLSSELERFKERLKESPEDYKVVHSPSYGGGGRVSMVLIMFLVFTGFGCAWLASRKKTQR